MESTDVVICGCGPTGALLSAYLGQLSVKNIVLEKEMEVVTDPRGIALDEDGIRIIQGLGLYDKVHSEIGETIGQLLFISGTEGLMSKPFLEMNFSTTEGGTGHVGGIVHRQPILEACLRAAATAQITSQIRLGTTVTAIEEENQSVRVRYVDPAGSQKVVEGKFLIGADGKTGFVRKNYLEPRGILLESIPGYATVPIWEQTVLADDVQLRV